MSLSACPTYSLLEAREKYLLSLKVLIYSLYPFFFLLSFYPCCSLRFTYLFFSPAVLFCFSLQQLSRAGSWTKEESAAHSVTTVEHATLANHTKKNPNCTTWSFDYRLCGLFLFLLLFLFTFVLLSIIAISLMHCVLIENT